jgi:hypothetical protein
MGTQPKWVQTPVEGRRVRKLRGVVCEACSLTEHDEPLGTLDTVLIGLGVTETLPLVSTGLIDLGLGAVTDEDGLTTPLDDDLLERVLDRDTGYWNRSGEVANRNTYVLALRDGTESDLNLGLGQDIGGGGHVDQEIWKRKNNISCLFKVARISPIIQRILFNRFISMPVLFPFRIRRFHKNLPWTVALAPTADARPREPAMK